MTPVYTLTRLISPLTRQFALRSIRNCKDSFFFTQIEMVLFISILILSFSFINLAFTRDTLHPGEFLYPNQSLVSNNGAFVLGFIDSDHKNYYVGIWLRTDDPNNQLKQLPLLASNMQDVARVANRENPIPKSLPSKLILSRNGNMIMIQSQSLIWSPKNSNTRTGFTTLVLLDTGNLVL